MFFIEDTTLFGNNVSNGSWSGPSTCPIVLAYCPEFLSLMEKSPDLDYALACSESLYSNEANHVFFIDRHEIGAYQKKSIDYSSKNFIDLAPQVIARKMLLTKEQLFEQGDVNGNG